MKSNIVNQVTEALAQSRGFDRGSFRAVPLMAHNRAESLALLCNPKGKLNRGARKALMVARSYRVIPIDKVTPRAPAVRLALKLRTLTMQQLGRRRAKFAREAATARYILAKLTDYSVFRSKVQATQDAFLAAFRQVEAEITARVLAAEGKLAPAVE